MVILLILCRIVLYLEANKKEWKDTVLLFLAHIFEKIFLSNQEIFFKKMFLLRKYSCYSKKKKKRK